MPLKPLIKWSGGKSDELSYILHHLPDHYNTYLEPFVGGGSLFFHLQPAQAVISDVHTELIDFYKTLQAGQAKDIYDFMEAHPNSEETYYQVRNQQPLTRFENAARFYYLRKTCFRGMLRYNKQGHFNIPFGKYKTINYQALLKPAYSTLLQRSTILQTSFETIFQDYNDATNFMFLDPPYDSEFTDYGYCKFGKAEHEKLAQCFKETDIQCLMVIGKTDFIEQLYRDYIVDYFPKKYKFKLYGGRIGEDINTEHLVIRNYQWAGIKTPALT